ncbi:MAG: thioredoxin domain-containing protein [Chloroflexota bacterium]
MPNRLVNETSPYLLQHANNPVDWYPWGEEALSKAVAEDKPIFLSIGYSACHWCHVMEHESFESDDIAAIMNQHFINIKVDREERPDLDAIYMDAVIALTQQGGWPMSVWLTPQGVPFYGGTYFPPTDRMGMPGFKRLLESLADIYARQKDKISAQGAQLLDRMNPEISLGNVDNLDPNVSQSALDNILRNIDYTHGGMTGAPKFPQPMMYDFLLRAYARTGDKAYLDVVTLTLRKMAEGGIYDQLGGGFHRYSTDPVWLAPHFEKMLYDNALLARLYLHAYQVTKNVTFRRIVEETLDYVVREMMDESGGFYSTQDADSEGEEGKFFVWAPEEILTILGPDKGQRFCTAFDVTTGGNWEGQSILRIKKPLADIAADLGLAPDALSQELSNSRETLYEHREKRIKPARDEKIITSWNGLMLAAFAEAGRVLDRPDYLDVAEKNANFILNALMKEGRLLRTWKAGRAKLMGYLEDYAFMADGLLALYQSTFSEQWFTAAQDMTEIMLAHFRDSENGGFFDTADDHEQLVVRPKSLQDNAIPSGNSMAIRVLLHMASYTGNTTYYEVAIQALKGLQAAMSQYSTGFSHWLGALEYVKVGAKEIAIIGQPDEQNVVAMLQILQKMYRPNQVLALSPMETNSSSIPLLNDRPQQDHQGTVYVCQNFTCQLPVTTEEALKAQL